MIWTVCSLLRVISYFAQLASWRGCWAGSLTRGCSWSLAPVPAPPPWHVPAGPTQKPQCPRPERRVWLEARPREVGAGGTRAENKAWEPGRPVRGGHGLGLGLPGSNPAPGGCTCGAKARAAPGCTDGAGGGGPRRGARPVCSAGWVPSPCTEGWRFDCQSGHRPDCGLDPRWRWRGGGHAGGGGSTFTLTLTFLSSPRPSSLSKKKETDQYKKNSLEEEGLSRPAGSIYPSPE